MSQTILVTGGAGYIGSHACKALAAAGYEPVVYDNLVYGHEWAVKWGALERGELSDRVRLDAAFKKYQPAAVMHFAAYAYVGESVGNPGKYYQNNVAATVDLLETMISNDVRKLVFSSTCATYGEPQAIPMRESHPQHPINPYGRTKLIMEQIFSDYATAHQLDSISLRYFNAAGADPDCEIGEAHEPETHLIPLILQTALGQRDAITVFGRDYDTPDGTCIRDYIHVSDLADAHILALRALDSGSYRRAYNLGNGQGFSVQEVIDCCRAITGRAIEVVDGPRRAGDPPRLVGDATLARRELGWEPQLDSIESIIETAWKWHQKSAEDD